MSRNRVAAADTSNKHFIRAVEHVQQKSNWDCGLACVLMAISERDYAAYQHLLANLDQVCVDEQFGNSTWTIDLCYLLRRNAPKMPFYYTTITMGVDPGYASQVFYNKILAKDSRRVQDRFDRAEENQVVVLEKSVPLTEIISHLTSHGTCIVLTNANLLQCDTCNYFKFCGPASSASHCLMIKYYSQAYQGHYILVVGYDLTKKRIFYRNPSFKERVCSMPFHVFDSARTSYGTDEDILFLNCGTS